MKKYKRDGQSGSALILTILILLVLTVFGSVLISVAMTNFKITRHSNEYNTAYFLADGAGEKLAASMEIIIINAFELTEDEINANSSDYIEEKDDGNNGNGNDGGDASYEVDQEKVKDDAYEEFLSFVRNGKSENGSDGLDEISDNDLSFDSDLEGDYTITLEDISYVKDGKPDLLSIKAQVQAAYLSYERRIILSIEIPLDYDFISDEDIGSDADGVRILRRVESAYSVKWNEGNIN